MRHKVLGTGIGKAPSHSIHPIPFLHFTTVSTHVLHATQRTGIGEALVVSVSGTAVSLSAQLMPNYGILTINLQLNLCLIFNTNHRQLYCVAHGCRLRYMKSLGGTGWRQSGAGSWIGFNRGRWARLWLAGLTLRNAGKGKTALAAGGQSFQSSQHELLSLSVNRLIVHSTLFTI